MHKMLSGLNLHRSDLMKIFTIWALARSHKKSMKKKDNKNQNTKEKEARKKKSSLMTMISQLFESDL